ncbi:MAG: ABC transporter ATP-binding protein [Clostridia bacterium]|nr:ABC transporter ATP-binding protein [Clostridia bacterium]
MSAIKTTNLTKKYGDKTVVNNLCLEVKEGEMYALLGVNGAGKSTTIKMLSCLTAPTSGEAQILSKSITKESESVKQIISVSPQETSVAPNLTVRENLEFIAGIYGFSGKEAKAKATKIMEDFDLTQIAKSRAKTLSGGWQRRLSIAMALISEPKVVFLDEPTLGLDVLARRELWSHIEKLKGKITIILTTHYLEEAEALSDRIGVMTKGELKAEGTASELKALAKTDDFEEAFVKICQGEV